MKAVFALLALLAPLAATAQVRPTPGPGDPHVQTVAYNADQVVLLQGAPGYQATIEFAPDEHIENVALGDSGAWQATPNHRGDYLFVKPVQGGVTTNMVVLTDVRRYAFELQPAYGPSPDLAYLVRFTYPRAESGTVATDTDTAADAAPPERGRYKLSGDRTIRPSAIDDDGTKTYIEWPGSRSLPAVYTVDAGGAEHLLNGNMRGDVYVIDSVVPNLMFRLDKAVARAVRVAPGKAH